MTIKLKSKMESWELEEIEVMFLYSYLFRFSKKNKIEILKNSKIDLSGELLLDLKKDLTLALKELIIDCYDQPDLTKLQKHPTRFERFIFEGKKFTVDYTTSTLGRLIYTLYLRINFVNQIIENNGTLTFESQTPELK